MATISCWLGLVWLVLAVITFFSLLISTVQAEGWVILEADDWWVLLQISIIFPIGLVVLHLRHLESKGYK